jgi:hypothetical protein
MAKWLTIENMGLKGLNTDQTAWALPPEFLTDGLNFRVTANQIQTAGGYNLDVGRTMVGSGPRQGVRI